MNEYFIFIEEKLHTKKKNREPKTIKTPLPYAKLVKKEMNEHPKKKKKRLRLRPRQH